MGTKCSVQCKEKNISKNKWKPKKRFFVEELNEYENIYNNDLCTKIATQRSVNSTIQNRNYAKPVDQSNYNYDGINNSVNNTKLFNVSHYASVFKPSCPQKEIIQINSNKNREFNARHRSTPNKFHGSIANKNQLKYMYKPPNEFRNLPDFIDRWNGWKEQLNIYLTKVDEYKNSSQWGDILINRMGPFGYDLIENIIFDKERDKKDFSILISKFDTYHKFFLNTKSKNENNKDYIERLKRDAAKDFKNIDGMINQKITSLENVKICPKCNKYCDISCMCHKPTLIMNCRYCGSSHLAKRSVCPANVNICSVCQEIGHFKIKCPQKKNNIKKTMN